MNTYKETEIGEIPKEWEIRNLGDDFSFKLIMGQSPPSATYNKEGNGVKFLQGNMEFGPINPKVSIYCSAPTKLAKKDDILVSVRAPVGEVNLADCDYCVGRGVGAIRPQSGVTSKFLYYYLNYIHKTLENASGGSTFKAITKSQLEKVKIALPSLPEQRAIASVLSTVDDAIAKADDAIKKTEKVKIGLANKFFREDIESVEFKPLSEVFEVKTGSTPSTKDPSFWKEATIRWLTPADLGKLDGKITIEDSEKKISNKALEKTNLTLMPKESIIMSTRAPVGYLAILKEESTFNQGCKGLIPKDWESTNTYYYAYYLLSQRSALENRSGQSTFKELSKDMLESFEVPVLSWEEQVRVVDGLGLIYKKIALEKSRKQNLERIKRGLMDELLTGRKRVKLKDAL